MVYAMQRETAIVANNGELMFTHSKQADKRDQAKWRTHPDYWHGNCSYNKKVSIMDPETTLENEMLATDALSVGFPLHQGCSSNFYHLIINYAVPLYAKMVEPFKQRNVTVPSTRVHVHDTGGPVKLLQEMVPDLSLKFDSWVCECCKSTCKGMVKQRSPIPNYGLSSDWFIGRHGYGDFKGQEHHRQLMLRYRKYMLQHYYDNVPPTTRRVAFIVRKPIPETATLGLKQTGTDLRYLRNGKEVTTGVSQLVDNIPNATFDRYSPEDSTFKEQVSMFSHTNMLIGLHGAGMTHCMWMPPESTILTITAFHKKHHFFSWLCGKVYGHRYHEFVHKTFTIPLEQFLPVVSNLLESM